MGATAIFRTLDGRPFVWTDAAGILHACEGADLHGGARLIWTLCRIDVPENRAHLRVRGELVTCPACTGQLLAAADFLSPP
jgi:hypothetical protein